MSLGHFHFRLMSSENEGRKEQTNEHASERASERTNEQTNEEIPVYKNGNEPVTCNFISKQASESGH